MPPNYSIGKTDTATINRSDWKMKNEEAIVQKWAKQPQEEEEEEEEE